MPYVVSIKPKSYKIKAQYLNDLIGEFGGHELMSTEKADVLDIGFEDVVDEGEIIMGCKEAGFDFMLAMSCFKKLGK